MLARLLEPGFMVVGDRQCSEDEGAAGPQQQADSAIGGGGRRHGERCRPLDCQTSVLIQQAAAGDKQGQERGAGFVVADVFSLAVEAIRCLS